MEIEKVDEITLALLYLTTFRDRHGLRARKSHSSGRFWIASTKAGRFTNLQRRRDP